MKIYLTAVGSGKTIKIPLGDKKYDGIIGIVEESSIYGRRYRTKDENILEQDKYFNLIYDDSNFKIKELLIIPAKITMFEYGDIILNKLKKIIKINPKIKIHIEVSQGYKELSHILILISQIIKENIDEVTFQRWDKTFQKIPISKIKIRNERIEILREFEEAGKNDNKWNGRVNTNNFVLSEERNNKFIHRVIKDSKDKGFVNEKNRLTDFGKLIVKYYNKFN